MNVVLAYCLRDQEITLQLLEWITSLGGCKNHKLILCRDSRCDLGLVKRISAEAEHNFREVDHLEDKSETDGWPHGANRFFGLCTSHLTNLYTERYFFWLEPDAIPLRAGWLDELEKEFIACKRPFMGDRVEVEDIPLHMSGVAFYPSPLHAYAGEACRALDVAWDMAAKDQIVPRAHFTKLIEHAWKHPTFTEASELGTQIRPEAVIFHSSKDGSLIRLLRQKLFPSDSPLEPVGLETTAVAGERISGINPARHDPAGSPTMDIFIRTYPGDYQWLAYCLLSICRFATVFRKVWVVSSHEPSHLVRYEKAQGYLDLEWKILNEECEDHYLSQQIHKLYADHITNYQSDYILHIDSDTVFTRPVTPQDFFLSGKVIWPATPYEKIITPWQPITGKFLKQPVRFEFMRRFPIVIPRWLYSRVREFCYTAHNMSLSDYVKSQPLRAFSEFNALGAYAFNYHKDKFFWENTETTEFQNKKPFARQFWSVGGITPEVKQELEQIFSRKIEPEENSGGRVGTCASLNIPTGVNLPAVPVLAEPANAALLRQAGEARESTKLVGREHAESGSAAVANDSRGGRQSVPEGIKELPNGIWIIKGDTHISKWVEQQGRLDHDMNTLPFILPHIKEGDMVVDAGAFIGDHTIAYLKAVGPKGLVYAYEPNALAYQCLIHNMPLCPNVFVCRLALGDKHDENLTIDIPDFNHGGGSMSQNKRGEIPMRPLDCFRLSPDFIKLDIEGCEAAALRGMKETIVRSRPTLVIEINEVALQRQRSSRDEIFSLLDTYGYAWRIIQENCTPKSPMFDIIAFSKISPGVVVPDLSEKRGGVMLPTPPPSANPPKKRRMRKRRKRATKQTE